MELFIKEQKLKLNLKTWVKLLYITKKSDSDKRTEDANQMPWVLVQGQ